MYSRLYGLISIGRGFATFLGSDCVIALFQKSFVSPYFTTRAYNRCYFLGNFLMELFCPFWYLGNVFLPIAFSGFQKKGPHRLKPKEQIGKGKDIKRSNKRFLYCAGVKKEEIYKVNQSRFINFLALKGSYSRRNIGFTAKSSSSKKRARWFMSAKSLYHTQGNFIFFFQCSVLYSTESIKN